MKKTRYWELILAVLFTGLLLFSCETEIEYRGRDTEPKTVIYALLRPDSLVSVTISESHSVFQAKWRPRQITNAVVRLYRDGELLETLTYSPPPDVPDYYPPDPYSRYLSSAVRPEYGHTYRIEADVPGFPKAYGETRLPDPVAITVADTSSRLGEYGNRQMTVKLKFRDPAGTAEYYKVAADALWGSYIGNRNEPYNPESIVAVRGDDVTYLFRSDPLIYPERNDDIFDMEVPNNYYIFSDELISGKEYVIRFSTPWNQPDPDYYEFARTYFRLSTITKDLYLYLRSFSAHAYTLDNFLVEPVPVYTNIINGLGVVGAISTITDSLTIGEYPVEGVNYDHTFWYRVETGQGVKEPFTLCPAK